MASCPHCQAPLPHAGARFCGRCGGPVAEEPSPPGEARLVVHGPDGEQVARLDRAVMTLGRAPTSDIVINAPVISREHARIEARDGLHVIYDLNSANGLLRDGRKVSSLALYGGETFRIGDGWGEAVSLRYERVGAAGGPAGRVVRTLPLGGRDRLRIGRATDNDLVLADELASRWHAEIAITEQGATLVDLGSQNGTMVNGRAVGNQPLRPGDSIEIGGTALRFDGPSLAVLAGDLAAPLSAPGGTIQLSLAAGPREVVIGRDDACDYPLDHPMVSGRHARIEATGGGHAVVDLGSANGTFVNGRPVRRQMLSEGDEIRIGPFRVIYSAVRLATVSPRTGPRIDAVGLRRVVKTDKGPKVILSDVTLSILPNEFVALVGGSGAGKSTLLTALSGFTPAQGRVLVNGDDLYRHFDAYRALIGYVPQTDIIHRALSVDRALGYVARLRLPRDTSDAERARRIEEVLASVDMGQARATTVSRLSGGQLKRVSTAVELLAKPGMLFLDEPTSGLDPGLDKTLMATFRQLAEEGRTVVIVTHATSNIHQCHKVAFMAPGGHLVYFGPPDQALSYFGKTDFADIYNLVKDEPLVYAERFKASPEYQRYVVARQREIPAATAGATTQSAPRPRSIGQWRQLLLLTRRYLELVVRDRSNLAILLAQAPIIGGLLWLTIPEDTLLSTDTQTLLGAETVVSVLAIVAVWFGVSNAAREITKELPIYLRERMANLGVLPHVFSKLGVLAGLSLFQTAILLSLVLAKAGVPDTERLVFGPMADMFVTLYLTTIAGVATGLLLSSAMANEDRAMSMTPIILVPQFILSGVMFALDGWREALSWLMLTHWCSLALGGISDIATRLAGAQAELPEGQRVSYNLAYAHDRAEMLESWGILALFTLALLVLAVVNVRRKDVI